jgi:hypothetical protein
METLAFVLGEIAAGQSFPSQDHLAARVGVAKSTISTWLGGSRCHPAARASGPLQGDPQRLQFVSFQKLIANNLLTRLCFPLSRVFFDQVTKPIVLEWPPVQGPLRAAGSSLASRPPCE